MLKNVTLYFINFFVARGYQTKPNRSGLTTVTNEKRRENKKRNNYKIVVLCVATIHMINR